MLLPSPEIQKRLEKYHTIDPIEARAIKLEQRRFSRTRNAYTRTLAGLALLGIGITGYSHDVHANQEIQASATISIGIKGEALDKSNDDNALVFIDGFGTSNGDILLRYMSKAIQPVIDGQLWSVDYNNAALETDVIAKRIIEMADAQNVSSISLVGYSAGGDIAMQVQQEVRKESNLDIEAIFLVSSPDGAKALRQARQDEIDLVEKFTWIPGVEYSTPLRFLGELAFRSDRYTSSDNPIQNIGDFFTTANEVSTSLETAKLPGTWLMFDQVLAIENAHLKARFKDMKDAPPTETRPTIVYIGTAKPGYDYMVDDKKSADNIAAYAEDAGVQFLDYYVPGAVHTRINIANDEYIRTLANAKSAILGNIALEQSRTYISQMKDMYGPADTDEG